MDGNELRLTHEFLAVMLGVRRSRITTALQELERKGLIAHRRSLVVIADREGVEEWSKGSYPRRTTIPRIVDFRPSPKLPLILHGLNLGALERLGCAVRRCKQKELELDRCGGVDSAARREFSFPSHRQRAH